MRPIQRVPDLRSQVYDRIRENLRAGVYPATVRLLEHGIAREFGVSRTPAREALAMLAREGLLIQEGRGFRIPQYTRQEISDVFEVRMRLEPFAVRLAVERATKAQLKELSELIETELKNHGSDETYVAANRRIRDAIFALCGNPRLVQVIKTFEDLTQYIRIWTLVDPKTRAISVAGMRELRAALRKEDSRAAEEAMASLLAAAQSAVLRRMAADDPGPATRKRPATPAPVPEVQDGADGRE
jgi:DNA-binding GntR family transcriptional regulator